MEDFEFSRRLHRAGRMVVLPATSTAASRRLTKHGTLRMVAFMQYLKLLFLAGVPPSGSGSATRPDQVSSCLRCPARPGRVTHIA